MQCSVPILDPSDVNSTIKYHLWYYATSYVRSATSFGWDEAGKVTSASDNAVVVGPIRHVISLAVVVNVLNCYTL